MSDAENLRTERPRWQIEAAELATTPLVLASLVHLSVLALRLPLLAALPDWMFGIRVKSLGPWYLLVALTCLLAAGCLVVRAGRRRPALALAALVAIGFVLQHGLAWSEGRGIDGMRDRIVTTGHAELAEVAAREPSSWDVLVRYEEKLASGELGSYARSKPPGTLLFYMATERLARPLARESGTEGRLEALRNLAAVTWPLISCLVLIPLFLTLRRVTDEDAALLACLLYLVVPSACLVTLHADQVLFPLLVMIAAWMATTAQVERSRAWAAGAGAMVYVATFCSFPLLLGGVLAGGFAACVELASNGGRLSGPGARALARSAAWAALGFASLHLLFAMAFDYDFMERLRGALQFHEEWKGWTGGSRAVFYFAWLDLLEFAAFAGVPIVLLALARSGRAIRGFAAGRAHALSAAALALVLVGLYLAFFGHTKAETARLWLFLIPAMAGLAAQEIRDGDRSTRTMAVVVVLQWCTVLCTKAYQDFW